MALGTLNTNSQSPGSALLYADGRFSLSSGQYLSVADVLRLDHARGIDWVDETTRAWLYANQEAFAAHSAPLAAAAPRVLDADRRSVLLAQTIQANVVRGARVESQGQYNAVLVWGRPVNHVLHLILTIVTAGLWGLVWLILALSGGESRTMVSVDDFGNVLYQQA